AAVIARELGKVAIVGCRNLQIAEDGSSCIIGGHVLKPGATVTLDGETGVIYLGKVQTMVERPKSALSKWQTWKEHSGQSGG
ncbi:MAG: hypothetical protein KGO02_06200, partial [Alphaproteobacteria bacterium]|nr:hypothetical protein [Alphaproteobacteria bacterium]